jgi:transcriptional regulator with XRE-family HTH domain
MALIAAIIAKRKEAGLTQVELAAKLKVYQSHIARLESGQRRVDVIELLDIADALNFDPHALVQSITLDSGLD